jgi:hypothetical protein
VIVPLPMTGQTISHGVHRNLKHIYVVACISAAGEYMTPFFLHKSIRRWRDGSDQKGLDEASTQFSSTEINPT